MFDLFFDPSRVNNGQLQSNRKYTYDKLEQESKKWADLPQLIKEPADLKTWFGKDKYLPYPIFLLFYLFFSLFCSNCIYMCRWCLCEVCVKRDNVLETNNLAIRTYKLNVINVAENPLVGTKLGTFEFRQHSATLSIAKTKYWISFLSLFVKLAAPDQDFTTESKLEQFQNLLNAIRVVGGAPEIEQYFTTRFNKFATVKIE